MSELMLYVNSATRGSYRRCGWTPEEIADRIWKDDLIGSKPKRIGLYDHIGYPWHKSLIRIDKFYFVITDKSQGDMAPERIGASRREFAARYR